MKILHISTSYPKGSGNIYSDLDESIVSLGNSVEVMFADPSLHFKDGCQNIIQNGVKILCVPVFRLQKVRVVKKFLSFISMPFILKRALKKYLSKKSYDLVIFDAPPITLTPVINAAKKLFKCPVFLIQKDIFPQNVVDIGMISKYGLFYRYFRNLEKQMLGLADKVGCMSQGNINYIRSNNPQIDAEKVIYFPNAITVKPFVKSTERLEICKKYGIPNDACIFLYGGNMGIPQYIQLLSETVRHFKNDPRIYFFCIGSGTESHIIQNVMAAEKPGNAIYCNNLPRDEYNKIAKNCDVGIVTLDPRYTIPNYPSKVLSYLEYALPVLAATDVNTDFRQLVENEAKCGLWCPSTDKNAFFEAVEKLAQDKQLRETYGINGRKYLENNFDALFWAKRLCELFSR